MRDCPTIDGSSIPLIIHRIAASDCLSRQSCNYHKCHRCIYRGKAASWAPSDAVALAERATATTGERAVPTRTTLVPRPEVGPQGAPAKKAPAGKPGRKGGKQASPTSPA